MADTKSNTEKSEKAIKLLADTLGKSINNGECYGLTAYYVEKMGGPQLMGSGKMNAWAIGSDYDWESHGWKVIKNPKPSDLKAGDVINWQGGGKIAISSYGHTGIIQSVEGNNTFKTFEQNAEKGRVSAEYTRKYEDNVITSLVRKIK
ncbi:mannosyl-glycoprotein endo-beta-N-acetylglucosaminidase [Enterococcus faecalis]|uniref:CHAP domain-containing protein n=1 Tax=Enterococcus faecalis TaxID=1351 RepID=UPI000E0794D2|nr:CHAP domain-containing protein [Enterococcus faecalis]STP93472.1 mannosyl-glycoprotein endo-beta-N-acetylglucosaminidase [Enterococcus faecalis]